MITQIEMPGLLRSTIPELATKTYPGRISLQVYTAMNLFTDYTRHLDNTHNNAMARKCFLFAEKLYNEGDRLVSLLVENCFIYSFSSYEAGMESEELKHLIPPQSF